MAGESPTKQLSNPETEKEFFLKPTFGRCIVQEDGFKYTGKLVIPEIAKRRPTTGIVVAAAAADSHDGTQWLGKRVLFARFSGTLLTFKNRPAYRSLGYEEIIAEVLKQDDELELDDTSLSAE